MRFGEAGEAGRASCSSACKLAGSESALRRRPPRAGDGAGDSAGDSASRLSARESAAPCLRPDSRDAFAVRVSGQGQG